MDWGLTMLACFSNRFDDSSVQCCCTSTETIPTIRDVGTQDVHLDFHTAPELWGENVAFKFSVALRPQRPYGLLGTGSPGRPPRLSHSTWALRRECGVQVQCCFTSTETVRTIRDGKPWTSTSTFTQHLSSEERMRCSSSVLLYVHRDRTDY